MLDLLLYMHAYAHTSRTGQLWSLSCGLGAIVYIPSVNLYQLKSTSRMLKHLWGEPLHAHFESFVYSLSLVIQYNSVNKQKWKLLGIK